MYANYVWLSKFEDTVREIVFLATYLSRESSHKSFVELVKLILTTSKSDHDHTYIIKVMFLLDKNHLKSVLIEKLSLLSFGFTFARCPVGKTSCHGAPWGMEGRKHLYNTMFSINQ